MDAFRTTMGWPVDATMNMALTTNAFNVGAFLTAVSTGYLLSDRYGRKPALVVGSSLFAAGGALQAFSFGEGQLLIGRLLAGLGVGITSSAGCTYIAEISPPQMRGALVGIYQNNVCVGIVLAQLINYFVQNSVTGWRYSLGVQLAMGAVVLVGLFFLNETPRFLERSGRSADALRILTSLRGGDEERSKAELEMVQEEIKQEQQLDQASWSEIFTNPFFRNVVVIGCLLQFFQILTGINAFVSYQGTLLSSLGIKNFVSTLIPDFGFTIGNAIGSFILVDRVGRRWMFILGMASMALAVLVGGFVTMFASRSIGPDGTEHIDAAAGWTIVAMIVAYKTAFGLAWGFGAYLYVTEIMPLRIRGNGVGLCIGMNWGPANIISAIITPVMINGTMGPAGTFLFFGCVSALVVPFAAACLPETKGKNLEEIAPLFHFSGVKGLANFVRGNLRGGQGAISSGKVDEVCAA
eukprot:TRINITY_DN1812_c0_g1_i10.p1 TRINITY_DN1812_c0_g1~~TRINITY_DN1812_c0_g1_i10.p1  ORF type:complete len:536 (-),score=91.00 TRINITY_DN1812_c0_g1_i10:132-1529(-)